MVKMSDGHSQPKAPAYEKLPPPRRRAARGGPDLDKLTVKLEVVTPTLGGSHETRAIDEVDVIRAPSIRGHLRFWWRALHAADFTNAEELYRRESAIWGRAANESGGRSAVEIRIGVQHAGAKDDTAIRLFPGQGQLATPGAYALWPARAETRTNTPTAPRRGPGTMFQLTLRVAGTQEDEAQVRNAVRAWILFGGYGSRTRRGLGSLTVTECVEEWLPTAATCEALTELFGRNIFEVPEVEPGVLPWLGGASLHLGTAGMQAPSAWTTALDWLREFRQGTTGPQGGRAREPGEGKPQPQRPSISNWPEADKIRHVKSKLRAHPPRHNATAAWPRAGFGLPIIGQFQKQDRAGIANAYDEPGPFELRWRAGGVEYDRLASPLIVKALPLADGSFVPCALWLNRRLANDAEVGLMRQKPNRPHEREIDPQTVAPLDRLMAPGDVAQFSALTGKSSLRRAFLDWLARKYKTTVVAP